MYYFLIYFFTLRLSPQPHVHGRDSSTLENAPCDDSLKGAPQHSKVLLETAPRKELLGSEKGLLGTRMCSSALKMGSMPLKIASQYNNQNS
jgi:hypothetical protein